MRKAAIFLALVTFGTATAFASENQDILAAVQRFGQVFQLQNTQEALETCAHNVTVVDDLPPYLWHGPGACSRWLATLKSNLERLDKVPGMTNLRLELMKPTRTVVSGDRAYAVAPLRVSYPGSRRAAHRLNVLVTLVLHKVSARWFVVSSVVSAY